MVENGRPLAAASRTPPFNAVLADPVTSDALDAVVDAVVDDDAEAPGFIGNLPHVHRAVERWAARTGAAPRSSEGDGASTPAPRRRDRSEAVGRDAWRPGQTGMLLVGWLHAFAQEATGGPPGEPGLLERMLDARPIAAEDPAHAGYTGCGRTRALP